MSGVRILGVDPGFSNLGLFGCTLGSDTGDEANFGMVVSTKPSPKKQRLHQHDDEHRRLEEIERAFIAALDAFKPDIVASETFPSLRSAQATRKVAMVYGALHSLVRARGIPWRSYSAQEIKKEVAGDRSASKEAMIKALKVQFPSYKSWPTAKKVEHIADAGGAALTARNDHIVGMLLRERMNAVDRLASIQGGADERVPSDPVTDARNGDRHA